MREEVEAQGSAPSSGAAPAVDPAAVVRLQRLGGDKLVRQMIRLYLENAVTRLAQIDGGLSAESGLDEVRRGAHSLKSSAANVGALRVSATAAQLEEVTESGDRETAQRLRATLWRNLEEAREKLEGIAEGLA